MASLKLALASDHRMVDPALVLIGSVLEHASQPVEIHFLEYRLDDATLDRIRRFTAARATEVIFHPVTDTLFGDDLEARAGIPLLALARMFLPRWIEGRVLYLDCDMLALGDIATLFDAGTGDEPLAAVRDFYVLDRLTKGGSGDPKLAHHRRVLGTEDVSGYFNSGLLLFDCDRIRADPALAAAMTDFGGLAGYRFLDQDRLNALFAGRTHYLPLAWNSIWGRDARRARTVAALDWLPGAERQPAASQLIHYTGPKKPWLRQGPGILFSDRRRAWAAWHRAARTYL